MSPRALSSGKRFATARGWAVGASRIATIATGHFLSRVLPSLGWASFKPSRIVCAQCPTVPIVPYLSQAVTFQEREVTLIVIGGKPVHRVHRNLIAIAQDLTPLRVLQRSRDRPTVAC
jgi:hypothetical protein